MTWSCGCKCGCSNEIQLGVRDYMELSLGGQDVDLICDQCQSENHQNMEFVGEYDDPLTVLKSRLANGEITDEEFIRKKDLIESE